MRKNKYKVATPVLLAQGEALLRQLNAPATKPRRELLKEVGIGDGFANQLKKATSELFELEGKQERIKSTVHNEYQDDKVAAEAGYRYKLALDARIRTYLSSHDESEDFADVFRFGKLRRPRARGVAYELRIIMPEVVLRKSKLSAVGIDDAFIAKGHALLAALDGERQESFNAVEERKVLTQEVQDGELVLSRLISQLNAADEVIALEHEEEEPLFTLNVIRTEQARAAAASNARMLSVPATVLFDD